jgi:two-component system NarL family sensor kinase
VVFLLAVMIFVPPDRYQLACWVIVLTYAIGSAVLGVLLTLQHRGHLRWLWLAPFFDVAVLVALAFIADQSATATWTADLLERAFFLIPVLAATLLNPRVVAAITVPTVAIYLVTSLITGADDTEPVASVLLRSGALAALGAGSVLMSVVQRARVQAISDLADDRAALLAEMLDIEQRERRGLAENLHDGALQYVLAARQDLESARDDGDAESFDRVEEALVESSRLLRSTLTGLHPAAFEAAGVIPALKDLVDQAAARGRLAVQLDTDRWGPGRTGADELLVMTARELLANVVKHAAANTVVLTLSRDERTAHLEVADDGRGMAGVNLDNRLAAGHLGVASRRIRVAAAGGRITFRAAEPHGTVVVVEVPLNVI